jgi:myo-inositol 2-dehydrogenase/D-chiro-inositol 1-dehydrogenase
VSAVRELRLAGDVEAAPEKAATTIKTTSGEIPMLRIGVLGCGRIGKVHSRSAMLNARCKVTAVADAQPDAARALAQETGARAQSAAEIIAASDIDAIIICSPTDTHADYIEAAARAGKATLCEKPVDLSADRIAVCLERIAPQKVPLMIGFNRRFDPSFAQLQQQLRAGRIGEIESVSIVSRDPAPPTADYIRRSGGLFRDMMIHDFDLARFLLGEEPVEVYAAGAALFDENARAQGDVDTAAALLKTARGAICQISCSRRASYGYDQRIEVHGSKGMLRAANIHLTTVECADQSGFHADPLLHFFLERYMPAYQRELDHFIDSVTNGTAPSSSGRDGLLAQRLADAATESAHTGRSIKLEG